LGIDGVVLLSLATLTAWLAEWTNAYQLLAALLLQYLFVLRLSERVQAATHGVNAKAADLGLLAAILAKLQNAAWKAPRLIAIQETLGKGAASAAGHIADLAGLADRLDWQRNPVFAPFAALFLWRMRHALTIAEWRTAN